MNLTGLLAVIRVEGTMGLDETLREAEAVDEVFDGVELIDEEASEESVLLDRFWGGRELVVGRTGRVIHSSWAAAASDMGRRGWRRTSDGSQTVNNLCPGLLRSCLVVV